MQFLADFHIHSCLSPCGSLDMSPGRILKEARARQLNLIALTDHNSALNCPALCTLGEQYPEISLLFGLEITSEEEAHFLCLFQKVDEALSMGEWVYSKLPPVKNRPEKFGDQVAVNSDEDIIEEVPIYLGNAAQIPLDQLCRQTHLLGGLCIPAHINREAFSLSSQLGYVPPEAFDALEYSRTAYVRPPFPLVRGAEGYSRLSNSDAHYPEDIGRVVNEFEAADCSLDSLRYALADQKNSGWKIKIPGFETREP